jgi:hypothetical protein
MQAAGWLKQVIDPDKPARVFIDVGGVGAGVYDRLKEWGGYYAAIVVPVNFGAAPFEPATRDGEGRTARARPLWHRTEKPFRMDLFRAQDDAIQASLKYPIARARSNETNFWPKRNQQLDG